MCTEGALIANKYQEKFKYFFEDLAKEKRQAAQSAIDELKRKGVPNVNWQQIQLSCKTDRSGLTGYVPSPLFTSDMPMVPGQKYVPVICDYLFMPSIVVIFVILMAILTSMVVGLGVIRRVVMHY